MTAILSPMESVEICEEVEDDDVGLHVYLLMFYYNYLFPQLIN